MEKLGHKPAYHPPHILFKHRAMQLLVLSAAA